MTSRRGGGPATRRQQAPLAWICLATLGACGSAPDGAADRPNVLLYIADTLRADALGAYGNTTVETPHLDALAAEGTLFEAAFASSSWTRASIASILTGTHPLVHGAQGREHALTDKVQLLSECFAAAGYATACVTTNPNVGSSFMFDQAYDEFDELYSRRDLGKVRTKELVTTADQVTDRAVAWLEGVERPFFLFVLTIDPHSPYDPPRRFDRYGRGLDSEVDGLGPSINRKDLSDVDRQRIVSLYWAEVAYNDAELGRLDDWLRAAGHHDDTLFLFTSDHGEEFWDHADRGHGKTLFDEVLHVPLIVRFPDRVPAGTRIAETVRTIDVYPTLLELAGLGVPAAAEGRSLFDLSEERDAFASLELDGNRLRSVRRGQHKLIVDMESSERRLYDVSDPERKDVLVEDAELQESLDRALGAHLIRSIEHGKALLAGTAVPSVSETDLSPEELDELQKLGYIEGDRHE